MRQIGNNLHDRAAVPNPKANQKPSPDDPDSKPRWEKQGKLDAGVSRGWWGRLGVFGWISGSLAVFAVGLPDCSLVYLKSAYSAFFQSMFFYFHVYFYMFICILALDC